MRRSNPPQFCNRNDKQKSFDKKKALQ